MKIPNPHLMRVYGTDSTFHEKVAGAESLAARVGAALLNAGYQRHLHNSVEKQEAQAAALNEQFLELERSNMRQADEGLRHTPVPMFLEAGSNIPLGMTEGMIRLASAIGADLAKTAAGVAPILTPPNAEHFMQQLPMKATPMAARSGAAPSLTARAVLPSKATGAAPKGFIGAGPGAVARGVAPAAQVPSKAPAPVDKGSPFTPKKIMGAAGILGAGMLAMKGVNKGLEVMSREPRVPTYGGGHETQLPMGVNEYGQPQMGTPLY